jgi:GH24 family phage-related lysozyme (muramidase)
VQSLKIYDGFATKSNLKKLERQLKKDEGFRPYAYIGHNGHYTTGWGHLISRKEDGMQGFLNSPFGDLPLYSSSKGGKLLSQGSRNLSATEGQTLLRADMAEHIRRARDSVAPHTWDRLPDELKLAIIGEEYRGSWRQSKKTREKLDYAVQNPTKENFKAAADEFLNNDEYRRHKATRKPSSIVARMERVADEIKELG